MKTLKFKRGLWYVLDAPNPYKVFKTKEEAQKFMGPEELDIVEKDLDFEDELDFGNPFEHE